MKGRHVMDIKITGAYTQYISPLSKSQHVHASHVPQPKKAGDQISLSSQAEDYKTAMRAVQITPDVRQDLVNSLREMITNGTYNISAHDVAARIFHGLEG